MRQKELYPEHTDQHQLISNRKRHWSSRIKGDLTVELDLQEGWESFALGVQYLLSTAPMLLLFFSQGKHHSFLERLLRYFHSLAHRDWATLYLTALGPHFQYHMIPYDRTLDTVIGHPTKNTPQKKPNTTTLSPGTGIIEPCTAGCNRKSPALKKKGEKGTIKRKRGKEKHGNLIWGGNSRCITGSTCRENLNNRTVNSSTSATGMLLLDFPS